MEAPVGRPRKKARDLTTDEAMRKLFPKKVAEKAKEEAEKNRPKPSQEQG
uniref:Uncharacterized protein n=1 Tax=uncultured bacterium 5G12 TaxID=1701325 RepID=A0A166H208_9BACT|nr:hypothetical protein 5G12_050 [uncultured bacterium 5G12]